MQRKSSIPVACTGLPTIFLGKLVMFGSGASPSPALTILDSIRSKNVTKNLGESLSKNNSNDNRERSEMGTCKLQSYVSRIKYGLKK